jgi:hypothetical protein
MAIATFVSVTALFTQDRQKPAYLSLDLPAQQRAEVFIRRMTVEEKVTQLVNESRAIPKLSLPASHLGYWDTKTDRWVVENDRKEIAAGGSSSDVRLRKRFRSDRNI